MFLCDNFSCPEGVYTTYRPRYRGSHAVPLFRTNRFYKKLFEYSVLFSFPVYDIKNNHAGSCNSADRNFRTTALYGRFLKWPTVRQGLVMEAPSGQWHVLTVGVTWQMAVDISMHTGRMDGRMRHLGRINSCLTSEATNPQRAVLVRVELCVWVRYSACYYTLSTNRLTN